MSTKYVATSTAYSDTKNSATKAASTTAGTGNTVYSADYADANDYATTPYTRGYSTPYHLRSALVRAHRTRIWWTTAAAALDNLSIPAAAVAVAAVIRIAPPSLAAVAAIAAAVIIGRQLRALENLAHEASHFNWSRRNRALNDALAFALTACPTGVRLADYREGHLLHHGRFGTPDDPDRVRYVTLGIEGMDRSSCLAFTRDLTRRLYRYELGWLATMQCNAVQLAAPACWVVVFVAVPGALTMGSPLGAVVAAVWLAGYLIALPLIRFVAESSEHVYSEATTVFDATITNLGPFQRALFHPHNDGYHTLHHMWPGIPHHQLRRFHMMLLREDPQGYGRRLRYRAGVLQQPTRGVVA
jgi:fatty acid desaturase